MRVLRFSRAMIVLIFASTMQAPANAHAADGLSWNVTPGIKLRYRVQDSHAIEHSDPRMAGEIEAAFTVALTAVKQQGDVIWFESRLEKFSMQRRMGGTRAEH